MKQINQFITEYIIKKKLDKPIDSEYNYHPQTKEELINNINECIDLDEYNLNVIDVSNIKDMSKLFRYVNLDKIKEGSKLDISKWNVSNVEFMNYMFCGCEKLDCDLSKWNIDKNVSMKKAFKDCNLKNKPSWYKE